MTCVIGLETPHGVALGSDSGSFGNHGVVTVTLSSEDTKIFKGGKDFVVGVAGSARFTNVLQYCIKWPSVPLLATSPQATFRWLVSHVVPLIRTTCKNEGIDFSREPDEDGDSQGDLGAALLGVGSRLYTLEEDWAIERSNCRYNAIGIGASVAMGAMNILYNEAAETHHTQLVLRCALDAAKAHSPFVREPWVYLIPEVSTKLTQKGSAYSLLKGEHPPKKEHRVRTPKKTK